MSDAYYSAKYAKGEYAQCDDCFTMVFPPRKGFPNQCECTPNKTYNKLESAYEVIMVAEKKAYVDTKNAAPPKGTKTPSKNTGLCNVIETYVQNIYDNHNDKWNTEWGHTVEEALVKFSVGYDNDKIVSSKRNWKSARSAEITNDKMADFIKAMDELVDV
jgi:hypothetical protein